VRGEVGREEGVVTVIPKPFDIDEVREMVNAILRPSTPP
jgi:DNA-binding response OmpR family regulator